MLRLGVRSLKTSTLLQPVLPAMVRPSIAMTTMRYRVDKRFFSTSSHDEKVNVKPDINPKILASLKDERFYKLKPSTIQNLKNADDHHYQSTAIRTEHIIDWLHERFITPEAFDILSDEDQKILLQLLTSNIGRYALSKKYITTQQFLSLDKDAQNDLMLLLEYAEIEKHYFLGCKILVDRVFSDKQFLLKFSLLPSECRINIKHDPDCIIDIMNGSPKAMELYGISAEHQKLLIARLKLLHNGESREENSFSLHPETKNNLQESKDSSTTIIKETSGYTPKIQPKHKLYYVEPSRKVKFLDKLHERFIELNIEDNKQNTVEKNDPNDTSKTEQANSGIFWNKGHVPEFTSTISKEQLDKINKASEKSSAPQIKCEFDRYRSLYYFRTLKSNPDVERNKQEQKPSKEADDMVVFSYSKSSNKK